MSDKTKRMLCSLTWCIILASMALAAPPAAPQGATDEAQPAFRIDQPGTITFTVGMVIKGKIEKPQVIIFLPKEKTWFRDLTFNHSFADDIARPLPFAPILE